MTFIITDPCIGTKDTACVDVCPVDCIHPKKDEPEFEQATMLYIHPGGVHRLRRVCAGLPGGSDIRQSGLYTGEPEGSHRGECHLPERRSRRDGASRGHGEGAHRIARGSDGDRLPRARSRALAIIHPQASRTLSPALQIDRRISLRFPCDRPQTKRPAPGQNAHHFFRSRVSS